ncbi:hypothetical protein E1J23_13090 [Xanthomonas gardneri]|nr:hypothetical protein [Xanthomonas hortorum pv. vitians]NMI31885.1 hypothetical protein [Xanthomonas hortorum pv. vitians]NMI41369.1 hypothetical protein [Xanthomonas hortorum pv. vitians]NMI45534.1 hypothetical protein [Xanthomonas hortorum pv. vitians]NMI48393.1 hypothetical protein [Xanthomonas hortorum pv. gardneri]
MRATGARALERPRRKRGPGRGAGVGVRVRGEATGNRSHEASHVPSSALRAPSPAGRRERLSPHATHQRLR